MSIEIINPWSGKAEYRYDHQDAATVESILAKSRAAFEPWAALAVAERSVFLGRIAASLRDNRERIGATMSAEMGKLHKEALAEIEKCAAACEYYSRHAIDYLRDQPVEIGRAHV